MIKYCSNLMKSVWLQGLYQKFYMFTSLITLDILLSILSTNLQLNLQQVYILFAPDQVGVGHYIVFDIGQDIDHDKNICYYKNSCTHLP